jgi:hypothetical protein
MYSDVREEVLLYLSLWVFDSGVKDSALNLLSGEVILMNDLIICKEVYLCLVELLSGEDFLGCSNKVEEHFRLERGYIKIYQKNHSVLWWYFDINTELGIKLLISTKHMIWWLAKLDTLWIDYVVP